MANGAAPAVLAPPPPPPPPRSGLTGSSRVSVQAYSSRSTGRGLLGLDRPPVDQDEPVGTAAYTSAAFVRANAHSPHTRPGHLCRSLVGPARAQLLSAGSETRSALCQDTCASVRPANAPSKPTPSNPSLACQDHSRLVGLTADRRSVICWTSPRREFNARNPSRAPSQILATSPAAAGWPCLGPASAPLAGPARSSASQTKPGCLRTDHREEQNGLCVPISCGHSVAGCEAGRVARPGWACCAGAPCTNSRARNWALCGSVRWQPCKPARLAAARSLACLLPLYWYASSSSSLLERAQQR